MDSLIHLIYCSAATHEMSSKELSELVTIARKKNAKTGITGMLLYSDKSFFQVLEGDEEQIDELFDLISSDTRHNKLTTIIKEKIPHREFGDWTMGLYQANPESLKEIDGLNDFFGNKTCLADLDRGRAKKLLKAFATGRWRQALE